MVQLMALIAVSLPALDPSMMYRSAETVRSSAPARRRSRTLVPAMLSLTVLVLSPVGARANVSNVFGPAVDADDLSVEYRLSYAPADGDRDSRLRQRLHFQYSFNERIRARLIAAYDELPRRGTAFSYSRLEVQWQYGEDRYDKLDAALRFELQNGPGSADGVRVAWAGNVNLSGGWQVRGNVLLGRLIGSDAVSGLRLETRLQATYRLDSGIRLGFEMFDNFNSSAQFGSFDDQRHQLGPVLKLNVGRHWSLFASYLAGISDVAEDASWRVFVGRSIGGN